MGLGLTAVTAWLAAINGWIYSIGSVGMWVIFGAQLVVVFAMSAMIRQINMAVATLMFVVYSILTGVTLSVIFFAYSMSSILLSFIISASLFGVLALWGTVTKKDMSSLSRILFPALIALVISSVINIFWGNSMFDLIISGAGVIIFAGLTVYDANKIKQLSQEVDPYNQETEKIALLGALTMYLDFINLFIYLLRILGKRK